MPHFNLIINFLPHSKPLKSYLTFNSNHLKLDQALSHLSTLFHHAAVLLLEITVLLKLQVTIHNTPGVIMDQVKLHFKTRNSAYFSTVSLQVPTTFSRLSQKVHGKHLSPSFQQCSHSTPHKSKKLLLQRKIFNNREPSKNLILTSTVLGT